MGITRRDWIKTASLSSGMALLGGNALLNPLQAAAAPSYTPRPLAGMIRLGSNENPYGPSPKMRAAMTSAFDEGCRYTFSVNPSLVKMIAEKEGVPEDHIVTVSGSG